MIYEIIHEDNKYFYIKTYQDNVTENVKVLRNDFSNWKVGKVER